MLDPRYPAKLLLGTRNRGKFHEIKTMLGDLPLPLVSLSDFPDVGEATEEFDTYDGNAIAKAKFYAAATGLVALADDSGLEVAALGGAPGVYSARYAGDNASDADRRALLLEELAMSDKESRVARFMCVVAIVNPGGEVIALTEGMCSGSIGLEARGDGGFGYDPIFIPSGFDLTFAQLSESVKNSISHRGRALAKARSFLLSDML